MLRPLLTSVAIASILGAASPALSQTYEWKIGTGNARPHPAIAMADYIKEQVETATDGDIEVTVYTIGQLGTQADMIENTSLGAVDMVVQIVGNAVPFIQEFQIFNFYYMFADYGQYRKVIDPEGPLFAYFEEQVADKLNSRLYTLSSGGVRSMSNSAREIDEPGDIEGLNMRASSPITQRQWQALGALPFAVGFDEQYTALQTGLIEGTENSLSAHAGSKIYEVAPYLTLTEHEFMTTFVMASEISMSKLPEEYQEIIAKAATESGEIGMEAAIENDSKIVDELVAKYDITV
ncbi:MAG: TRAP transporter substrate-binding protein, partial [Pseudomonadota bacterium]